MRPWSNEKLALPGLRCTSLRANDGKVAEGVLQENVIPTAGVQRGNGDILMLAYNSHRIKYVMPPLQRPCKFHKKVRSNILLFQLPNFSQYHCPLSLLLQFSPLFAHHSDIPP